MVQERTLDNIYKTLSPQIGAINRVSLTKARGTNQRMKLLRSVVPTVSVVKFGGHN
jgi:hypothetical protein